MRRISLIPVLLVVACVTTTHGPPTMPLTPGAEVVEIRDTETIKKIDLKQCRAIGQTEIGPVGWNNVENMIRNETYAKGGNLFFGTSWLGAQMTRVTGMIYRCDSLGASKAAVPTPAF